MSEEWSGGSSTRWRKLRAVVLKRDRYRCRVGLPGCTLRAPLEGGHVDHIIPLSQSGDKWDPANCRASCASCNLKRGKVFEGTDPEPAPISNW